MKSQVFGALDEVRACEVGREKGEGDNDTTVDDGDG